MKVEGQKMEKLRQVGIVGFVCSSLLIYGFFYLLNFIYEYETILSRVGVTYQNIGSDLSTFFILNAILQLIFGILTLISSLLVFKENKIGVYILILIGIITSIFMFIIIRPRQEYIVSAGTTIIIPAIRLFSNHTIDIIPFIILIAGLYPFILKIDKKLFIKPEKKLVIDKTS